MIKNKKTKKSIIAICMLSISSIFLFGCNKKVEDIEIKDQIDKATNDVLLEIETEIDNNVEKEYIYANDDFSNFENPKLEIGNDVLSEEEFENKFNEEISNIDFYFDPELEY